MARKEYTEEELTEIRSRGKEVIFSIDLDEDLEGRVVEVFDLTEEHRDNIIFADIPKGEGFIAFEIIEVGDSYHDAFGDLKKDILLASALERKHLTNWVVTPETKATLHNNSRVVRL
jgi:hypothetical protein